MNHRFRLIQFIRRQSFRLFFYDVLVFQFFEIAQDAINRSFIRASFDRCGELPDILGNGNKAHRFSGPFDFYFRDVVLFYFQQHLFVFFLLLFLLAAFVFAEVGIQTECDEKDRYNDCGTEAHNFFRRTHTPIPVPRTASGRTTRTRIQM